MTSKVALVTDLHFGARNDNTRIIDFQERFYRDVFFPYIDANKIDTIICLGDAFDRRKYINFYTLHRVKKFFYEEISKRNIDFHALVGNHDSYYRNTLEVNSPSLLTGHFDNFHIYTEPKVAVVKKIPLLFLPWICKENEDRTRTLSEKTTAQIVIGHFELAGYQMHKGHAIDHGMDDDWLERFDIVCTGHYHTRSRVGNINYLGAPYEMTWSDYDDPKGFHILDLDKRELGFIRNPFTLFKKLDYNDTDGYDLDAIDYEEYRDCYVKVVIINKDNPHNFDQFIERLEQANPIDLQVVDDHLNLDMVDEDLVIEQAADTLDILNTYIKAIDIKEKKGVQKLLRSIYEEAISQS